MSQSDDDRSQDEVQIPLAETDDTESRSVLDISVNVDWNDTAEELDERNAITDDTAVKTTVKGETVSTGRRKFGVVCGDGVKTGIQTSLNAGCVLGTGETTIPGEQVM